MLTELEWVGIQQAAQVAGVHPNTVRAWVRDKKVRSELHNGTHGPTYRVALEDLASVRSGRTGDRRDEDASGSAALIERLAQVEDARLEEARARARAEARLEELDDVRRALDDALRQLAELRSPATQEEGLRDV